MKRLYYLTESMESTESISDDLHNAGVTDWNFHVVSKHHEAGLYRRHIHSANLLHKSDIVHCAERGVVVGFVGGILASWFLANVPVFSTTIGQGTAMLVILFGVLLGGWLGGFVGIQTENYKLKRFHDKIEEGYFLILVDVEVGQEEIVREIMEKRHQEAQYAVSGSSVITPFHEPKSINL